VGPVDRAGVVAAVDGCCCAAVCSADPRRIVEVTAAALWLRNFSNAFSEVANGVRADVASKRSKRGTI
jgi:hypothetical protein